MVERQIVAQIRDSVRATTSEKARRSIKDTVEYLSELNTSHPVRSQRTFTIIKEQPDYIVVHVQPVRH